MIIDSNDPVTIGTFASLLIIVISAVVLFATTNKSNRYVHVPAGILIIVLGAVFFLSTLRGIQATNDQLTRTSQTAEHAQQETERIRRFAEIARLNPTGAEVAPGPGLAMSGNPLFDVLQGTYYRDEEEGGFRYKCDPTSMERFEQAVNLVPDFPFSYFAVADCLLQENDPNWRPFADQAIELLEETTQIGNHHQSHDTVLEYLRHQVKEYGGMMDA